MGQWVCEWCGQSFTKRGTTPRRFCCRAHSDQWMQRDIPSPEWLREEYVVKGRTANDIAREVGRDPKRVWEWIVRAGIPTRPRGSYKPSLGRPSPMRGKKHTPESIANMTASRRKVPSSSYANNGRYLRDRRGPAHPNWKGGHTPSRQAFYASREWKAAAQAVWARDKGVCQRCGAANQRTHDRHARWHVHHIIGFANEATRSDIANLILLCPKCHRWVHGKSNHAKEYLGEQSE